jgi:hypothetical protein
MFCLPAWWLHTPPTGWEPRHIANPVLLPLHMLQSDPLTWEPVRCAKQGVNDQPHNDQLPPALLLFLSPKAYDPWTHAGTCCYHFSEASHRPVLLPCARKHCLHLADQQGAQMALDVHFPEHAVLRRRVQQLRPDGGCCPGWAQMQGAQLMCCVAASAIAPADDRNAEVMFCG